MIRIIFLSLFLTGWQLGHAQTPPALEWADLHLLNGDSHRVMLLGSRSAPYMMLEDGRYLVEQQGIYYLARLQNNRYATSTGEEFGRSASYQEPEEKEARQASSTVSAQANPPVRTPYRYEGGAFEQPLVVIHVAFSDQLNGKRVQSATPLQGLWSVIVASAAQTSIMTRRAVDIPSFMSDNNLSQYLE